jgi:predicted permease
MFSDIVFRTRAVFRRGKLEREMNVELQEHYQRQFEKLTRSGLSREEAMRQSRLIVGGPEQLKEQVRDARGTRFLENFSQDLRYAARMLRKSPGFTAIAVLTLALGIGANTAIFSVVNALLLKPLPYPDANRIAIIWSVLGTASRAPASVFELNEIRRRSKEFDQVGGIWVTNGNVPGSGEPEQVKVGQITTNFLSILCPRPELGRLFTSEDEAPNAGTSMVISHGVWARRFGSDPAVIGKQLRIRNNSLTVVGVLPQDFRLLFPDDSSVPPNVEVFFPVGTANAKPGGNAFLRLIGRLHKDSNVARAQAEADSIAGQIRPLDRDLNSANLQLHVVSLQGDDVRNVRSTLLFLFGGVGFVALIACANVANLLLARASKRQRETTIRAALGASHSRIVRQLLTESLLLGCIGGAVALPVGYLALKALLAARPPALARLVAIRLDVSVLAFTFVVALLTSVLFGLAPVFASGRLDLVETLKSSGRLSSVAHRRSLRLLVAAEIALGFALLAGTGLLVRTFVSVLRVDPGFRPENVFGFQLSGMNLNALRQLQQNLSGIAGVQSVSVLSHMPLDDSYPNWYDHYWTESTPPEQQQTVSADYRSIFPGLFGTIGATLIEGRDFTDSDDPAHEHVVIIDDVLAKELWPNESALGKKLNVGDSPKGPYQFERDWAVIVGVVRHVQYHSLTTIVRPQIYVPFPLAPRPVSIVIRTAGEVPNLSDSVRTQVRLINKGSAVSRLTPLSEYVAQARSQSRFASILAATLAAIALLLACIGIYGVSSYSVSQRTGEIGVRMALGAQPSQVVGMVFREGFLSALWGLVAGFVLALLLMPLLKSLLFGVKAGDVLNYAAISALLMAVSALAAFLPARRATRIDPLIALRNE